MRRDNNNARRDLTRRQKSTQRELAEMKARVAKLCQTPARIATEVGTINGALWRQSGRMDGTESQLQDVFKVMTAYAGKIITTVSGEVSSQNEKTKEEIIKGVREVVKEEKGEKNGIGNGSERHEQHPTSERLGAPTLISFPILAGQTHQSPQAGIQRSWPSTRRPRLETRRDELPGERRYPQERGTGDGDVPMTSLFYWVAKEGQ